MDADKKPDMVNHPPHYTNSGIVCENCGHQFEVITITEHYNFCLGNALKYILRHDLKDQPLQDLKKARWYLEREIKNREKGQ